MNCLQCGTPVKKEMRFCPACGTPVRSDDPAAGQDARVASLEQALKYKYKIVQKIGSGGFAEVYLGEHSQLGRQVAIKILLHSFVGEEDMIERFRREAKAAAKLSHPNIIDIYDVGEGDGIYFIVM
jgi:serine/threonine protein kinase